MKNGMNRKLPRDAVATALASQIDCSTFIDSACDGVVATFASAAAFSAKGASTASFGDACCAPSLPRAGAEGALLTAVASP